MITEEAYEQPEMSVVVEGQPIDESSQNKKSSLTQRVGATAKEAANGMQHNDGNTVTPRETYSQY